jgi:Flp pilus assembly protein TadB
MESPVPFAQQFDFQEVFWVVVSIQFAGLFSAWLARQTVGGRAERPCQRLFLACLALVGVTSVVAMGISAASWLFSAATLALMVIAAVWDFGRQAETESA